MVLNQLDRDVAAVSPSVHFHWIETIGWAGDPDEAGRVRKPEEGRAGAFPGWRDVKAENDTGGMLARPSFPVRRRLVFRLEKGRPSIARTVAVRRVCAESTATETSSISGRRGLELLSFFTLIIPFGKFLSWPYLANKILFNFSGLTFFVCDATPRECKKKSGVGVQMTHLCGLRGNNSGWENRPTWSATCTFAIRTR
jgi:hypothetical protein